VAGDMAMGLHIVAMNGDVAEVRRMVAAGAELRVQDANGETPLQVSVRLGHHQVAEVLRELERTLRDAGTLGWELLNCPWGGRILLAQCGVARIHQQGLYSSSSRQGRLKNNRRCCWALPNKLRALPIQYVVCKPAACWWTRRAVLPPVRGWGNLKRHLGLPEREVGSGTGGRVELSLHVGTSDHTSGPSLQLSHTNRGMGLWAGLRRR
jgi:hypothetical protein